MNNDFFGSLETGATTLSIAGINQKSMTSTVEYKLVRKVGPVEIREYPSLTLATVLAESDDSAFSILFEYISGNNEPNQRIAMTAPVISKRPVGERIAMTSPVISKEGSFSFIVPSTYDVNTAPHPKDPRIIMERIPPRTLAVIRFSGRAQARAVSAEEQMLLDALQKENVQTRGQVFLMRYNSPFTPGFLRHNELGIEIVDEGPA
jgi:hypothetical protein